MMIRRLVKVEKHRVATQGEGGKQSDPEQGHPEEFQPLLEHGSRRLKFSVCLARGQAILFLPALEPPGIWRERLRGLSVYKADVRMFLKQLVDFVHQNGSRKPCQVLLASATAVFGHQLLPIDGLTNAAPPLIRVLVGSRKL